MPATTHPEYAYIGRSNVGKSSLINMLCARKELALVSKKPGKTRAINLFVINDSWNLVDLPGYGYAKVSKTERKKWNKSLVDYFRLRRSLVNIFVLVDANIPPQAIDIDFINYLGENGMPFSIVFTKIDKSSKSRIEENILDFKTELNKFWEELPPIFQTSAKTGSGREEILEYIFKLNQELVKKS